MRKFSVCKLNLNIRTIGANENDVFYLDVGNANHGTGLNISA